MGHITLNAVWVSSWKATREEADDLRTNAFLYAEESKLGQLVTNVSCSANGLTQFMIMPCSAKEHWPDSVAWERLVTYVEMCCAGSYFSAKRLYVASN